MSASEPEARVGVVEPRVAAEFPGLVLRWVAVSARGAPSPAGLRGRLRELSDRGRGARVVAMRTQPIAHAYRSFYRQTGLDPDVNRIPSEAAAVARLLHGGFESQGRLADALLVALVETGVPVWALSAAHVETDSLGIRTSAGGLVIADAQRVHAPLFSAPPAPTLGARGHELVLVSVGVDGVPAIFLEEALWLCAEILTGA